MKKALLALLAFSATGFALAAAPACTVKDNSQEGAILLRVATRFGDLNAVKTLINDKCVDPSGKIASNPKLDHAAFLATTPEVFNFYAQQGFDYTKKADQGRTFLMISLEREKDDFKVDAGLKAMAERAAKKYGITPSVPTKAPNETAMQELYVKGVPAENLLERDVNKNSALHHVVSMGKGTLAQIIVKRQPEALFQKNAHGLTPLMISAVGCTSPSLTAFYKSIAQEQWLKSTPVKDFENVSFTPAQMHLLSGRADVKNYVSAAKITKEQEDLDQTFKKIPALHGILVKNIENSNICSQKNQK